MAANKVGIVLACDGEQKFKTDLAEVKNSIDKTKSVLEELDKKYKDSAGSVEALTNKQSALKDLQSQLSERVETTVKALRKSEENLQKITEREEELRKEKDKAISTMKLQEALYGKESEQYEEAAKKADDYTKALDRELKEKEKELKSIHSFTTENTKANTELEKTKKEIKKNEEALRDLANSADKAGDEVDDFGDEAKNAGKNSEQGSKGVVTFMDSLKLWAGHAVINGLQDLGRAAVNAGKEMIKMGIDFTSAMSKVSAISGATNRQMDLLTDKARQLGRDTVYSAAESAEAMQQLALSGMKYDEIISSIDGVLNLAAASGMEIGDTAEYVANNINAFGESADYAGQMADIMAYAMSNSATTTEQLGEAYSYSAATAHAYGYSVEEVTAAIMTMGNAGIKGGRAGQSLNTIMTRLATNTSKCATELHKYGVDIYDPVSGNMRSLSAILNDTAAAWGTMSQEEQAAITKTIAGTRQGTAFMTLMQGMSEEIEKTGRSFNDYTRDLENSMGTADEMAGRMLDNLGGDVTLLKDAMGDIGLSIFSFIETPLRAATQETTSLLQEIGRFISGIGSETEKTRDFIRELSDEARSARDEVSNLINSANTIVSDSEFDVAVINAYKDMLLDLYDAENKVFGGENADPLQTYMLQGIVQELSEWIPELNGLFDATTGTLHLTNTELEELVSTATEMETATAHLKAYGEARSAIIEATTQEAQQSAVATHTVEKYADAQALYNKTLAETHDEIIANQAVMDAYGYSIDDVGNAMFSLSKDQSDASDSTSDAIEVLEREKSVLEELGYVFNEAGEIIGETAEDGTTKLYDEAEAIEEVADAMEDLSESSELSSTAAQEAIDALQERYKGFRDEIISDINSNVSIFDAFDGGKKLENGADEMLSNLEDQLSGLEAWEQNMMTLANYVGDKISPEFYNNLLDMGVSGANAVQQIMDDIAEAGGDTSKLEQMSKTFMAVLDKEDEIADTFGAQQVVLEAGINGLNSTPVDLSNLTESIKKAIDGTAENASESWGVLEDGMEDTINSMVAYCENNGVNIPDALASGIEDGSVDFEGAMEVLSSAVKGQGEALIEIAEKAGIDIDDSIKTGMEGNADEVVAAYDALISKLSEGSAMAQAAQEGVEEYAQGMTDNADTVNSAMQEVTDGAAENTDTSASSELGKTMDEETASGITENADTVRSAVSQMVSSALNGIDTSPAQNIGMNIALGVAAGISAGQNAAVNAAVHMMQATMAATQKEADIHSPSRKFRDLVGKQIAAGFAKGIKDGSKQPQKEAEKMSAAVLEKASAWLTKYKKSHKLSLENEEYFWSSVLKKTKKGTDAYDKVLSKMEAATLKRLKIGTPKSDANGYYADILSAAQTYQKNLQIMQDVSLQDQLKYWQKVAKNLKRGTQAFYNAQAEINAVKEDIAAAEKEAISSRVSNQSKLLDNYKTYNNLSLKAEMQYWDQARNQFDAGTQERIDADKNYLEAKAAYYDKLKEIDEQYASDYKEIVDEEIQTIKDLKQEYDDAVKSRKQDILSSMNLFEAYESTGYDANTLINNLRTQVEGLTLWEGKLEALRGRISDELYEYLASQGPEAAANIYSLAEATDEQLTEYQRLFDQRNALAQSQALKDNEKLLSETNEAISDARKKASDSLTDLESWYSGQIGEVGENISSNLVSMLETARTAAEETIASFFAEYDGSKVVQEYASSKSPAEIIAEDLADLPAETEIIGKEALSGLLKELTDAEAIRRAAFESMNSIVSAFKEAGDIHSPSRRMADEIGYFLAQGIGTGITDGTQEALAAAAELMDNLVASTRSDMEEYLTSGGVEALNRLAENYEPDRTVVNVDNSSVASMIDQMARVMDMMVNTISGMQVVLDSGETIGALTPGISRELAERTVRYNRGRF